MDPSAHTTLSTIMDDHMKKNNTNQKFIMFEGSHKVGRQPRPDIYLKRQIFE